MTASRGLLAALCLFLLTGCAGIAYYSQSVQGHLDLMARSQPVEGLLEDPQTPRALADQLRLTQQIRDFASRVLKLPDNGSYRSYADLGRDALVWSVVATPEFSLKPRQWCYPVIGCASYRGYFDRKDADALAAELAAGGQDVVVQRVDAYSTLGWFDDPLTSLVIGRDEAGLAAMIFHELAHQRIYVKDDSAFNESYATAVEEIGLELWLGQRDPGQLKAWYMRKRRHAKRLELMRQARSELERLYADTALGEDLMRQLKKATLEDLGLALTREQMARSNPGTGAQSVRSESLNNAHLASVATYHQWVPAFWVIWRQQQQDPSAFHAGVEALSALPRAERDARLQALMP